MIVLYTQNLAKQLGLGNRKIDLPESSNPDAVWHGNILLHKRKKVLHLCHQASRCTIQLDGKYIYPSKVFKEYFEEALLLREI